MASPSLSAETMSLTSNSSEGEAEHSINTTCKICRDTYTIPKVLLCFHTFCQPCLTKLCEDMDRVVCPECGTETQLPTTGVNGLLSDFAVSNVLEANVVEGVVVPCTGCKTKDTKSKARCYDCANYLCENCTMAHQFMHCFEGHRVSTLAQLQASKYDMKAEKPIYCSKHKQEPYKYFCKTCNMPICNECTVFDHSSGSHDYNYLHEVAATQTELLMQMAEQAKVKANDLRGLSKSLEHSSNRLLSQFKKCEADIVETFNFYQTVLEERKQDSLKELDQAYNSRVAQMGTQARRANDYTETIYNSAEFIEKLLKYASATEGMLFKKMLEGKLQGIFGFNPDNQLCNGHDLEFMSNYQAIQSAVYNTFGYVRQPQEQRLTVQQQSRHTNGLGSQYIQNIPNGNSAFTNGVGNFDDNLHLSNQSQFSSNSSLSIQPVNNDPMNNANQNLYEKWSNGGGSVDIFQGNELFSTCTDPVTDLTSKLITANIYPPKSQIKRQKMIYNCKFGEFGVAEAQFTEPSGVAINAQNDIIVADTNNHRIQIFDKEGRFKFQFGECGKRDGQLLYPNRVAVVKTSGDIVVTERSPTHQVQIYNQYGQFVRKFGANILQHPRGVTVDNKGRIIIVECKVMRVIIFDQMGNVIQKFGCSKHLEFPNGVVVNDREEIMISDNRAHCVKVFSYHGVYFRQIGGEGITNYPIGVGINSNGEVLVADNHNNFNLTVFSQDGQILHALESKVKHAQCFDVALMDEGSIVLASKDYRLYIYRYVQLPGINI